MNYTGMLICDECDNKINVRVGASNKRFYILSFVCNGCGSPIYIKISDGRVNDIDGAHVIAPIKPFDEGIDFVDLHIDFPVRLNNVYSPGITTFIRSSMSISNDNMLVHKSRISDLNGFSFYCSDLKKAINYYIKGKDELYRKKINYIFNAMNIEEFSFKEPIEKYFSIYKFIGIAFSAFFDRNEVVASCVNYEKAIKEMSEKSSKSLDDYIVFLNESGFLKNAQFDCLKIYPLIMKYEILFRAALFLDFDSTDECLNVPHRVSALEFNDVKDLYKDIVEVFSRQLVIVAGINNILKRGDFDKFLDSKKVSSLNGFADFSVGSKPNFLDDLWCDIDIFSCDNKLRNAIAHCKVSYDEITQEIVYFPSKEGVRKEKSQSISFLSFSRKLLLIFREMHKLNHLIKSIYIYSCQDQL